MLPINARFGGTDGLETPGQVPGCMGRRLPQLTEALRGEERILSV